MKRLSLQTFIPKEQDLEINQYKVLAGIRTYRAEFLKNKLYPSLAELVYLSSQLEEILNRKTGSSFPLPKGIKGYSSKDKNIIVEIIEQSKERPEYLFSLIEWALPQIKEVIDEAYVLYDFVEHNMRITKVGVASRNKLEGYLMVPDNAASLLYIHRYDCIVYSTESKPFHSLKTTFVQTAKQLFYPGSAESIKLEIIKKYREHPGIATFLCEIDMELPYMETVFPIAKRKLLSYLVP